MHLRVRGIAETLRKEVDLGPRLSFAGYQAV